MSETAEPMPEMTTEESVGDALLVLALDGFQGPIDLLLHLAKDQKVDLAKISMVRLADQYLAYLNSAKDLKLEIAADYLVMAAWLAYLKSRLLLPKQERSAEDEPTGEELAAALAWQMRRLEAMQKAANDLIALPQLGFNSFTRGMPEGLRTVTRETATAEIYDLMQAYAAIKRRAEKPAAMQMAVMELFSIEEAVERMRNSLGFMPEWTTLQTFMPSFNRANKLMGRSAIAATLIASLELAKQGLLEVRQESNYAPIYLRRARGHLTLVEEAV